MRRAFPEFRSSRVNVDAGGFSDIEKLVEFGDAVGVEFAGLKMHRVVSHEHANAVHAQFFHPCEIFTGCFGIERFPNLRCPASAGSIVIYTEWDEWFPVIGHKRATVLCDADFLQLC